MKSNTVITIFLLSALSIASPLARRQDTRQSAEPCAAIQGLVAAQNGTVSTCLLRAESPAQFHTHAVLRPDFDVLSN
jgi:hypothetical protein